jgi:hypothetical protein
MSKNEIAVFGRDSIVSQSGVGIHDAVNEYIGSRVLGDFSAPRNPLAKGSPHAMAIGAAAERTSSGREFHPLKSGSLSRRTITSTMSHDFTCVIDSRELSQVEQERDRRSQRP